MAPTRRKARTSLALADASLGEMTWACWRRRGVTPPYLLLSLSRGLVGTGPPFPFRAPVPGPQFSVRHGGGSRTGRLSLLVYVPCPLCWLG